MNFRLVLISVYNMTSLAEKLGRRRAAKPCPHSYLGEGFALRETSVTFLHAIGIPSPQYGLLFIVKVLGDGVVRLPGIFITVAVFICPSLSPSFTPQPFKVKSPALK